MSELEILQEFKTQLVTFFDELIAQFPEEGEFVVVRLFISSQIVIADAIESFTHTINKNKGHHRMMVTARDEDFFLKHDIFSSLGKQNINHFKKLWVSGRLDEDDKKIIWSWIDTFIFLSDKWAKQKGLTTK
jgi:hypothetical protein